MVQKSTVRGLTWERFLCESKITVQFSRTKSLDMGNNADLPICCQ